MRERRHAPTRGAFRSRSECGGLRAAGVEQLLEDRADRALGIPRRVVALRSNEGNRAFVSDVNVLRVDLSRTAGRPFGNLECEVASELGRERNALGAHDCEHLFERDRCVERTHESLTGTPALAKKRLASAIECLPS